MALASTVRHVRHQVTSTQNTRTREGRELLKFLGVLQQASAGEAIGHTEYQEIEWQDQAQRRANGYKYVVCSMKEAEAILQVGSPMVPIIVPAGLEPGSRTESIDDYLNHLSSKDTLDVHFFNKETSDIDPQLLPCALPASEAISQFKYPNTGRLNFLSLSAGKSNTVPRCLQNLRAYNLISSLRNDNQSGKQVTERFCDLSACSGFQILQKRDVFSLAHLDRYGVITTIFCEEGEKLWMTWPAISHAEITSWADSTKDMPAESAFPLSLQPGDLLIQPAGRVHAPYSMIEVLMTGTMHWDSREMLNVLELSTLEREYPKITNEDTAQDFLERIMDVHFLWQRKSIGWPWASLEKFTRFEQLIQVSASILSNIP